MKKSPRGHRLRNLWSWEDFLLFFHFFFSVETCQSLHNVLLYIVNYRQLCRRSESDLQLFHWISDTSSHDFRTADKSSLRDCDRSLLWNNMKGTALWKTGEGMANVETRGGRELVWLREAGVRQLSWWVSCFLMLSLVYSVTSLAKKHICSNCFFMCTYALIVNKN